MKEHFHTYKKIIILLPLLLLGFLATVQGQVEEQFEFKLQYMEEGNDSLWGVFVRPLAGFETGKNDAVVGSGQITILMRNNGLDSIHNIQSVSGRWNGFYDVVKGPTEATDISYLFIGLSDGDGINLEDGEETLLLTFQVPGDCPDTLGLIDNALDPFNVSIYNETGNNSVGNNPGMDLSTFNSSTGRVYNWEGNYNTRAFSCGDCDSDGIADGIEDSDGDGLFSPGDTSEICNVCDPLGIGNYRATLMGGDTVTLCGAVGQDSIPLMVELTGGWSPFVVTLEETEMVSGNTKTLTFTDYEIGDRIYVAPSATSTYVMTNITDSPPQPNAQDSLFCTISVDSLFESVEIMVEGPLTFDNTSDAHPVHYTACNLDTLFFEVDASNGGDGVLLYQWQVSPDSTDASLWRDIENGTPYAFATTDSLIISNPLGLDGNFYRAKIFTPFCDTLYSYAAELGVDGPFIIDVEVVDASLCALEDEIYFYTETSVGQGNFNRKWEVSQDTGKTWIDVSALSNPALATHTATTSTAAGGVGIENIYYDTLYITNPLATMNKWQYRIAAVGDNINACTEIYTNEATLTIEGEINITVEPVDVAICSDAVACFGVTTTNVATQGETQYQWYVLERGMTDIPANWAVIANDGTYSGARADTLCVTNVIGRDSFQYRVEIQTTECAIKSSASATLSVDGPISFEVNAIDVTVCADEDPNIFAFRTLMGQGVLNRRWQVNRDDGNDWVDLTIVDTFSVGIDSVTTGLPPGFEKAYFDTLYIETAAFYMDQWQFRLATIGANSSNCEDTYSDEATLTVEGSLSLDVQPVDVEICSDTTACFGVTIGSESASGIIEYQWYVLERGDADIPSNWTALTNDGTYSGVRADTLCVTNVIGRDSFAYRVEVKTGLCAIITSNEALLRIDGPISFELNAEDVTVCAEEDPNFFAYKTLMGQGLLDRRWQVSTDTGKTWTDVTISGIYSTGIDSSTAAVDLPAGFEKTYFDTLHINIADFTMNKWQYRLAAIGQNSNNCTDTYAREATLTVEGQISITPGFQPVDVALCSDTAACFGVQIINDANQGIVQYQWEKLDKGENPNVDSNWEVLSSSDGRYAGVRSDTMCVLFIAGQDSTQYRVRINTGLCGDVLSATALLNVDGPIEHIENPQDETTCAVEDAVSFTSATSIGQGRMLKRWQVNKNGGAGWEDVDLNELIYSDGSGIEENPSTGDVADSIYYDTLYISGVVNTMNEWQYRSMASGITGNGCNDVPSEGAILTVEGLISITTQPINVDICSDTAACFGVEIANETMEGNIQFQWQALPPGGATWITLTSSDGRYGGVKSDTLCVNNVAGLDSFAYRVYIFTDVCANVYSDSAVLNVSGPIDFDVNPQDVAVCAAEDATFFNARATIGQGGLINRWQVNKNAGAGWEDVDLNEAIYTRNSTKELNALATLDSTYYDTLFLAATATAGMDQWQYRIVANGLNGVSCQDISSDAAILTVNGSLHVDTEPRDTTVCSGQPALFEVRTINDASGEIRYRWQKQASSGIWVDLSVNEIYNGVRDSILSISDVAKVVAGQSDIDSAFYRVAIFTDECDRIYSQAAELRVEGPFEFATAADSPHDTVVCAGEQIIFRANPRNDGFGDMIYEWKISIDGTNFGPIPGFAGYMGTESGTNTTVLTLNPTVTDHFLLDSTFFRLDITSTSCSDVTSSLRALLRVDGDLVFDLQPQDTTNCADKGVIFFANITNNGYTGQDGIRYQWQELEHNGSGVWQDVKNEGVYNGASTDTLSIDITTALDSNQYRVITWTSVCNQETSAAAYLIEEGSAAFTDHPEDVIICSGEMTSFTARMVNSTGQGDNFLNWQISTNNGISWRNINPITEAPLFTVVDMGPTDTGDSTATASTTTLSVNDVEGMQGYRFRAAVTSTYCDTVFSQLAKLTVEGPFLATLTGPATVCANIGVDIEADVVNEGAGLPVLTWQWKAPTDAGFSDISTTWDIFDGEETNGIGVKILRIDSVLNENSRENLPAGVDTFYNFNQYQFRLSIVSDTCEVAVFSDTFTLNVVADTIGGCDWDLDGLTNTIDLDDDNDGLTDSVEHYITTYAGSEPQDSVAQFDTDTDNNSVTDNEEDADEDTISNGEEVDDDDGNGNADGVNTATGVFTGFPALTDPNADPNDIFNGDPLDPCDPILSPSCVGVVLDINVKLQGAMPELGFDLGNTVLMRDQLRSKSILPKDSPYEDFYVLDSLNTLVPAFVHVKRDSVKEEIPQADSSAVFGDMGFKNDKEDNAVVDWVFVEIRDGSKLDSIVTTRAALLQRDGDVRDHRVFDDPRKMDADGYAYLTFDSTLAGDYYVSVRHRNHLGVMTNDAGLFSPIVTKVDFTEADFNPLGIHSQRMNEDSTEQYMWAGDVTSDRRIIYQGPGNDIDEMFFRVIADPGNISSLDNYIVPGYYRTDFDLNGNSIFQGPNNDRQLLIFRSILQFPDNKLKRLANYVILEQLP
ncbi:MAG: hypothetical protein AB8G86_01680 [Saprospiraceae bacterium]